MNSSRIQKKAYFSALLVLFALMVLSYVLTLFLPCEGLPVWKWVLSPALVLGSDSRVTLIAVIAFLLVLGGVFSALEESGVMRYLLALLTHRFKKTRYRLMAVIVLFFMLMGSMIGSFEEIVPLVPLVTALSVSLGWDVLLGLGMSVLAVCCGFACGVANPFTVGVAQELASLPMFSGIWLRALSFLLIYFLLLAFLRFHAKRLEKTNASASSEGETEFEYDTKKQRAVVLFAAILGAGILIVLLSGLIPALQDYSLIVVALSFLVAGVCSVAASGMQARTHISCFCKGLIGILPAVLMILMASSIRYILEEAGALDIMLDWALQKASQMPRSMVVLFIYLIVLVLNFFIASGSAKAFIVIPMIAPIASAVGIPLQLCILAYAFGDGFSNVFYPTNPVLLISLGLSDVSYGKWFKWSVPFQLVNLMLTAGILLFGLAVGYM